MDHKNFNQIAASQTLQQCYNTWQAQIDAL